MYESDNVNFDDMGCTWNAGHMIGMISYRVANLGGKKSAQNGNEK